MSCTGTARAAGMLGAVNSVTIGRFASEVEGTPMVHRRGQLQARKWHIERLSYAESAAARALVYVPHYSSEAILDRSHGEF